jgi:hypothetical protein
VRQRGREGYIKASTTFDAILHTEKNTFLTSFGSTRGCASSDVSVRLESESLLRPHSVNAYPAIVNWKQTSIPTICMFCDEQ